MPFQGENAASKEDGMGPDPESSTEDIRLTLFIASSSFIIMTLITIIGVVSCVILCNDNDLNNSNLSGNDSQDIWQPGRDSTPSELGGCSKKSGILSGEEDYLSGTITPGHVLSPDGGSIHWTNHPHFQLSTQQLVSSSAKRFVLEKKVEEGNYFNYGLAPITENSQEETKTANETNPNPDESVNKKWTSNNGSCVPDKSTKPIIDEDQLSAGKLLNQTQRTERPVPPRPPRKPRRNPSLSDESQQQSPDQNPLQLNVTLAPVAGNGTRSSIPGGVRHHCKHCSKSQHGHHTIVEKSDKASNTEKTTIQKQSELK